MAEEVRSGVCQGHRQQTVEVPTRLGIGHPTSEPGQWGHTDSRSCSLVYTIPGEGWSCLTPFFPLLLASSQGALFSNLPCTPGLITSPG